MTGDGVNDAMAIKDADLGIAMGTATAATKAVSRIVLLDNRFDRLPDVLAFGRRVIANVERVSNIFLAKTVYGILLALVSAVRALAVPVPAAAAHPGVDARHRHPVVLPRAGAQPAHLHAGRASAHPARTRSRPASSPASTCRRRLRAAVPERPAARRRAASRRSRCSASRSGSCACSPGRSPARGGCCSPRWPRRWSSCASSRSRATFFEMHVPLSLELALGGRRRCRRSRRHRGLLPLRASAADWCSTGSERARFILTSRYFSGLSRLRLTLLERRFDGRRRWKRRLASPGLPMKERATCLR